MLGVGRDPAHMAAMFTELQFSEEIHIKIINK